MKIFVKEFIRESGALLRICFDKKYIITLLALVRFVNDFIYLSHYCKLYEFTVRTCKSQQFCQD